MVDKDIILAKAGAVKKHLRRIEAKAGMDRTAFIADSDSQDIVLFNMTMAVQNCIDIAAHIVSDQGFGVPGNSNEMFYMLEEHGYLQKDLSEKMVKAVGFRNLVVHEYAKLDLNRVHSIITQDIQDLATYIKAILSKLNIS